VVTVGNDLPPEKPTVARPNADELKMSLLNQQNIDAIKDTVIDPLKDAKIDKIEKDMPSEEDIKDKIDKIGPPPLTQKEKDDLMQAIKDGDSDKVADILDKSDAGMTLDDWTTLTGLADVNDLINKHKSGDDISSSDIKIILDNLKDADPTLVGDLVTGIQDFGKLNKVEKILDIASDILKAGAIFGGSIPTGVVAIVTFPDLPFGVVFPLGNGVYGVGTGGAGNVGIWQGHLPQPPVYPGGNIGSSNLDNISIVLHNQSAGELKWRFGNGGETFTLGPDSWANANLPSRQIALQSNGRWISSNVDSGAYEAVETSRGNWTLQKQATEVILKSPGNPIPFTFFIGGDRFVIEPGKSLTINAPNGGNSVYEIQFARSSDVEDVATHVVGGKMTLQVGRDKTDGKWSLFPEWAEPEKPTPPRQNATAASSSITYDDTPITAANVGGLPVLPSYD
jgi:hypothetical protein